MASMLPKPDVGRALALLSWQQEGESRLHGPGTLRWLPDHWRVHEQKDENPWVCVGLINLLPAKSQAQEARLSLLSEILIALLTCSGR